MEVKAGPETSPLKDGLTRGVATPGLCLAPTPGPCSVSGWVTAHSRGRLAALGEAQSRGEPKTTPEAFEACVNYGHGKQQTQAEPQPDQPESSYLVRRRRTRTELTVVAFPPRTESGRYVSTLHVYSVCRLHHSGTAEESLAPPRHPSSPQKHHRGGDGR